MTSVTLGVLTVDAALRVRTWDEWLAQRSGITADAARGRRLADVVPSLAERGLLSRFENVLASGQVQVLAPAFHHYLIPCPPVRPSAHFAEMQQRVTLGPLREGEAIVGVMATVEDVTERIDAERELALALQSEDPADRERAARQLAAADGLQDPAALAAALRDDSWRVRRAAVQGLSRHADGDTLGALLNTLQREHSNFNVLSSALQLLAASDIDVTGSLAAMLTSDDADLRMQVALALGQQDNPAAAEALAGRLDDPDINVRFHAIEALGRLRARGAVDALAGIAETGDFFLAFPAIAALGQIGDPRVAPRLARLLESAELSEAVAETLGELGDADVAAPLVAALNEGRGTTTIVRALARLHDRYERFAAGALIADHVRQALRPSGAQHVLDAVTTSGEGDARAMALVLGWLRGPAAERALARLLGRPEIRADVIEAIVRYGSGIVDVLVEQLESATDDDALEAVTNALGRIGDRRATPALTRMLTRERRLVVAAAGALAAIGDPAAFEALMAQVGHPDVVIRQAVIGALNSLGHPEMPARVRVMLEAPDAAMRESAVRIAGYFGYRDCLGQLMARCSDADENVRRAALEQLPHLDDASGLPLLARALTSDTPRARASAAQALGSMDQRPAVGTLLLEASRDQDVWVRYFAARALARHGEAASVERLAELLEADPAMPVRLAAIESLGALGAAGGDRVVEILRQRAAGADADLAARALGALGQLPGERAFDTLMTALRDDSSALRLAAVEGLSRRGDQASVEALQWTAAADAEEGVAGAAIDGLARLGCGRDQQADPAIGALLTLTSDARFRTQAVAALGQARRVASVAAGLHAADAQIRIATIEALSLLRQNDASAAIRAALDDDDAQVRCAAIAALHRAGTRGLAHILARLAHDDPSREVRRAAAAALGASTPSHVDARD